MNTSTTNLVLASDNIIDLHLHTTYSDGLWTPEQLLDYLVNEQFGLAAITDHDRVDTAGALQELAMEKNLPLLVAVEMTTHWQDDMSGKDEMSGLPNITDLLCYEFDSSSNALNSLAQNLSRRQCENTVEVYENLQQKGYIFSEDSDELTTLLKQPGPQQPHALVALMKKYSYGTGQPSAGRIVLEEGCRYAYNNLAVVVDAAHQCGAVCLIAHPGRKDGFVTYDVHMLDKLRQEIPVDGLEVYHPKHTPAQILMFKEYAEKNNLLVSSGSDSHSSEKPPIQYKAELSRGLLERVGIKIE